MPSLEVAFSIGQEVIAHADDDSPARPTPRQFLGRRGVVREISVYDHGAGITVAYRVQFDGDLGHRDGALVLERWLRAAP